MGLITKPNTFSAGATIVASEHNDNFDTIYNEFNGSITNANLSNTANVADTKLAQITTANKVALSALATTGNYSPAGIWDFTGTIKKDGTELSNNVIQIVNTTITAVDTGTTTMNNDDSIPPITEGDEYITKAITPKIATSILKIDVSLYFAHGAATAVSVALFQDTTTNALAAVGQEVLANKPHCISFTHYMTSGTTSETTFRVRAGGNDAGTMTVNGVAAGRKYGGKASSSITITELYAT